MSETWDGKAIVREPPYGATVVVYRTSPRGTEFLILHRAHHGAEYDGDWAWTPPAGARQPGETVTACARRELLEETGLQLAIRRIETDAADWAVYLAEAEAGTQAVLQDEEHDRFEWVSLTEAQKRCRPEQVARGIEAAARIIGLS